MRPGSIPSTTFVDGELVAGYLTEVDHPWLRALIAEHDRFVGRPERGLADRLREPLSVPIPPGKRDLAIMALRRSFRRATSGAVRPSVARAALFGRKASSRSDRDTIVGETAQSLHIQPAVLEAALFGDLPGERCIIAPKEPPSPAEIALQANGILVQSALKRAAHVSIDLVGHARAVVRQAKLRRLIVTVATTKVTDGARLEISGPLSILRRTTVYGRALASLVEHLPWCASFLASARCVVGERECTFHVSSGDPLPPATEPRLYDSQLEARFAKEFSRTALDWELIREPEPVQVGSGLVFPDFAVQRRGDPTDRWLLEIVGFWTPDYLRKKLADYRAANLDRLILCMDSSLSCGDEQLPRACHVVRFRRRIDPESVKGIVESTSGGTR